MLGFRAIPTRLKSVEKKAGTGTWALYFDLGLKTRTCGCTGTRQFVGRGVVGMTLFFWQFPIGVTTRLHTEN